MSRHRNIRQMNYEEEYDDYYNEDDYYEEEEEEEEGEEEHVYDRSSSGTHLLPDVMKPAPLGDDVTDGARQSPASGGKAKAAASDFVSVSVEAGRTSSSRQAATSVGHVAGDSVGSVPSSSSETRTKTKYPEPVKQKSQVLTQVDRVPQSTEPESSLNNVSTPANVSESSKSRSEAEVLAAYERERGASKGHVNMVVIGHVDAGKSTLMGCLLHRLGYVSQRIMHKLEAETQKLGKQSFKYAWLMDETDEERCRGVTMDVAQVNFETDTRSITVLDAPGHRDFIPNMITGASAADVALLVVNAARGEFETGFDLGGQTREHAVLVRSLGVSQMLIAVNKLDTVDWSEQRFLEIRERLASFLRSVGFRAADLCWVPCSGLSGANLVDPGPDQLTRWYSGPSLIQAINEFRVQERLLALPVRASVVDVFRCGQQQSLSLAARLESGMLRVGDRLILMPAAETVVVKQITVDGDSGGAGGAFAGDHVTLSVGGADVQQSAGVGSVLCQPGSVVSASSCISVRLVVFEIEMPITCGLSVEVHLHAVCVPGTVVELLSQLHRSSGRVQRRRPRHLAANCGAEMVLRLSRAVCVTRYAEFRAYARVSLRSGGSTIAAGVVTQVN